MNLNSEFIFCLQYVININIIKIKSLEDNNLSLMWEVFTKVENIYDIPKISSKERYVFPLFIDNDKKVKRLKYK